MQVWIVGRDRHNVDESRKPYVGVNVRPLIRFLRITLLKAILNYKPYQPLTLHITFVVFYPMRGRASLLNVVGTSGIMLGKNKFHGAITFVITFFFELASTMFTPVNHIYLTAARHRVLS